jgi:hypothetical protein
MMRAFLTAAAALAVAAASPTSAAADQAQRGAAAAEFSNGVRIFRNGEGRHRPDGHRRHGRDRGVYVSSWSGGEWALYNNRSWEPDSYNDWWHERPQRSYPRWMSNNADCQRVWWSGGGWRC